MKIKIFLISGKARSGKDTFYELIRNEVDHSKRLAFGDFVKDVAYSIGWDGQKDDKGRDFLQWLGDGAREYNLNVWTNKMIAQIEKLSSLRNFYTIDNFFITDVRYPNEITELEQRFPVVKIRVERPGYDSGLTLEQLQHPSETALDDYKGWDYVVINDGTLEDYSNIVKGILKLKGVIA